MSRAELTHRYTWSPRFTVPGLSVFTRKGELCRILARGHMNSVLVEFADGETAIVSRYAVREAAPVAPVAQGRLF